MATLLSDWALARPGAIVRAAATVAAAMEARRRRRGRLVDGMARTLWMHRGAFYVVRRAASASSDGFAGHG
jgi:hypothetical protein